MIGRPLRKIEKNKILDGDELHQLANSAADRSGAAGLGLEAVSRIARKD